MIFLLFSVLSSASLLIFFKLFERWKIEAPQAIAVNYLCAATVGIFFVERRVPIASNDLDWYSLATGLGCLFALIFNLSRYTTQKIGLGITSVAMKLGVVFPVLTGIVLYRETFSYINYFGVLLGFVAIVLLNPSKESRTNANGHRYLFVLPFLVWLGSGICDSSVQIAHKKFALAAQDGTFSFVAFWTAGAASLLFLIIKRADWNWKMILGGVVLGIPNYFSIYFLLKGLESLHADFGISSSMVFLTNNLSVVLLSVLIGVLLFKEPLSKMNYLGLILAIFCLIFIGI